ncbi:MULTISPECIES: tRNA glutamyl-Q(34) synthetase GluQRS [Rhodococcus]|jgi:glutamyl-tRNA synthetase|uniref:tRNA glutamyl-Q(34) synthetase GluQRS n=1 Tax=Rhodococcus TaxID=1827 RepID=UPI00131F8B10|nr:glutamyl-Q-tRNA synthetase [Rhodococcus sp. WAY2]
MSQSPHPITPPSQAEPNNATVGAGRFAPSPSGDLHLGNLRTALLAWLFARSTGRRFLMRVEDLDRVRPGAREQQLADLRELGLDWDEDLMVQSDRLEHYRDAVTRLESAGLTYECFCTRREILKAPSAPHAPHGAYPGICRNLTREERDARRAGGRPPALRLRAEVGSFTIDDLLHGSYSGMVDDLVLRRGDGTPAYNLAVVVDDAAQGVDQVVRGDDLLSSAPRQAYLAGLLGLTAPQYAHVPLALDQEGRRLAKRAGAVTLGDQKALGRTPRQVLAMLATSLRLTAPDEEVDLAGLLDRFEPARLPREPWVITLPTTPPQSP